MSLGGGSQESSNNSRPLTGPERADIFNNAIRSIGTSMGQLGGGGSTTQPAYNPPAWQDSPVGGLITNADGTRPERVGTNSNASWLNTSYDAPSARTLSNGDYGALEKSIIASRTAPLDTAWTRARTSLNQEASNRGVWDGGVPIQKMMDTYRTDFLPAYQQAGADAATQRYGLQSQENAQVNSQNMENASRLYAAKNRPADYLAGLWNGTSGALSSGSSGGWNFSI